MSTIWEKRSTVQSLTKYLSMLLSHILAQVSHLPHNTLTLSNWHLAPIKTITQQTHTELTGPQGTKCIGYKLHVIGPRHQRCYKASLMPLPWMIRNVRTKIQHLFYIPCIWTPSICEMSLDVSNLLTLVKTWKWRDYQTPDMIWHSSQTFNVHSKTDSSLYCTTSKAN